MRLRAILGVCLGVAIGAGGCDPVAENKLFREGVGTDLSRPDIAAVTRSQDIYIGYICQQAGLDVVRSGDAVRCSDDSVGSRNWALIVQAGMNDIDQRCDAYLAWLDDRRRSRAPILNQITAISTATQSIARFSGVEGNSLSIVAEAFGIASHTFNNLNSRLILEVNHSTVQSVVVNRRNEYRIGMGATRIDNRPAAIHALRSYLNICMPFTIEMEINTTITAFQFGGPSALDRPPPNSPDTVRGSMAAVIPREQISRPKRPELKRDEELAKIFDNYNPAVHDAAYLRRIQDSLCAPQNEFGKPGPVTMGLVRIFESAYRYRQGTAPARRNGKLDDDEISEIRSQGPCAGSIGRNYFERRTFTDDELGKRALSGLITNLKKYEAGRDLQPNATLAEMRAAIGNVRNDTKVQPKLRLQLPKELSNQITDDLFSVLMSTQ